MLPEYHLTNWLPKDPNFAGLCDQWETYLKKYQDLAKECGICIVPGTIVEGHKGEKKEEDRLLNVAYFIGKDGVIVGKYVKKNLWYVILIEVDCPTVASLLTHPRGPERDHLTSSTSHPHEVFDTPIGKVGMLICWDLAFPEAFRELIAAGAKIIIIPTFWTLNDCNKEGLARNPASEALFLDSMLTARAFENTCAIVFANAGGPPGKGYAGLSQVSALLSLLLLKNEHSDPLADHSQVTVPFVGPLAKLGSAAEGMIVVDLDLQTLEDAEANYQIRSDISRSDWHYDYRHSKLDNPRSADNEGTRDEQDNRD